MSIDFDLINQAVIHTRQQLTMVKSVVPGLCLLEEFLYPEMIEKLQCRLLLPMPWQPETTQDGDNSYPNRFKVTWEAESVIEEIHTVFDALTPSVNQVFGTDYQFQNITIWRDLPGYSIGWHRDNPQIALALQIYMTSGPDLHTEFQYQDQVISANYQVNSGYIMHNQPGILHAMPNTVPKNHERISIYGIWKNE